MLGRLRPMAHRGRLLASRLEGGRQLRSGGDPELWKDPVEVRSDRAVGEEQPLADLAIGQARRRQLGDLQLLGGEPVASVRRARPDLLAGGSQLLPCAFAPARRAQNIELVDRVA
jgi:hypothetical protein